MSASHTSDLAALMLLAVRQLEAAMQDASAEAELLSRAIASLGERGAHMRDSGGEATHAKALPILADTQRAMNALQFHDRLSQRIAHVRDALAQMHCCLDAGSDAWRAVGTAIRAAYTMEDERRLFDAVMTRMPRPAPAQCEAAPGGSVELF